MSEQGDARGNMLSSLKQTLRSSSNPAGGIAYASVAKLRISPRVTDHLKEKGWGGGGTVGLLV